MISLPQYDLNGDVVPHNHPEILPDDLLIRRINPDQHVVPDDNTNRRRISSKAYQPSSGENQGMSIDIEKLILADGHDPTVFVIAPPFLGAVSFTCSVPRGATLQVGYDPIPGNNYHGEVWGTARPNRFPKSAVNALRAAARWYVSLPDVDL